VKIESVSECCLAGGGYPNVDGLPDRGPEVLVYWRPGCPYCWNLRRGLRRRGLLTTEVNIWADADAAATVRRVAGGNETVPTVIIGDTSLVNPTAPAVVDLASRLAPDAIGAAKPPPGIRRPGRRPRWRNGR